MSSTRPVPSPHLEAGLGIPRLARSTDGGRTFAPAIDVPAADGVEIGAAITDLSIAADGTVSVAWLDYRAVLAWHTERIAGSLSGPRPFKATTVAVS